MSTESPVIDELDRQLVERLRARGRITNRSLGTALGVSETTVAGRIRRLEASSVVRVVALTDIAAFGFDYFAFLMVDVGDRPAMEVAAEIAQVPEAISVTVGSGSCEITCAVLAKTREDMGRIVSEQIGAIRGVQRARCDLATDVLRFDSQWASLSRVSEHPPFPAPALDHAAVDDLDLEVVAALQRDARSSNRSIAAELKVSEGTIRARLKRLEDERLIRICAVSDVEAFGLGAAAAVGVYVRDGAMDEVGQALMALDGAAAILRTLGQFDFVVFLAENTRATLMDIVFNRIQVHPKVRATEIFETVATLKHAYTWTRLVAQRD